MIRSGSPGDRDTPERHGSHFAESVAARFGLFPNFFRTAKAAPRAIEDIFAFAKAAYLDNPLPSLFKERLFVRLSRFSEARYCVVRHTGFLLGYGRPAGDPDAPAHSLAQVMALLTRPLTSSVRLPAVLDRMESLHAPSLPEVDSEEEKDVFDALTAIFVVPRSDERARSAVRRVLGDVAFEAVTALVAYIRVAHHWTEMHPEISFEPDVVALMEENPLLAAPLLNSTEAERARSNASLHAVLERFRRSERALRASEEFVRLACHAGRMGTWRIDTRVDSLSFDAAFATLLGLPEHSRSIALRDFTARVGALAGASLNAVASAAAPDFRSVEVEVNLSGQSGGGRWIRLSGRAAALEPWMVQGVAFGVNGGRADAASLGNEARSRSPVGSIAQATWETDGAGSMATESPSWRAYTGQTIDECLGYGWIDAVHPDDRAEAARRWREGVAAGRNIDAEFRVRCAITGEYRWTNILACPLVGADGTASKWVGINVDIDDRKRAQNALRVSELRLANELADVKTLQRISTELIPEQPTEALYELILDAAMEFMSSDAASLQLFAADGTLKLLASRGFAASSRAFWQTVEAGSDSTCGRALAERRRVYIDDLEKSGMSGPDLDAYRASKLRSAQSTPLVAQSGTTLGMISTHWTRPQAVHERNFARFDVLARLVADIVHRSQTETILRERDELQASLLQLDDALRPLSDPAAIVAEANSILDERIGVARSARLALPIEVEVGLSTCNWQCAVIGQGVEQTVHERSLIDAIAERTSLALNRARADAAMRESRRSASEAIAHDALRRRLVLAEEEQRRRFARELHDEAGQHLAALNLGLKALSESARPGSDVEQRARDLRGLAGALAAELHGLAFRLRPLALDDFGLAAALRSYVDQWSRTSGIAIDLHTPSGDERISPDAEGALYRIVQEALTNVALHSGAQRAGVILERRGDQIQAIIEDDGCGFDTSIVARRSGGGLGLLGIEERVELLRGTCEIESAPGRGTMVLVRVPAMLDEERGRDV